VRAGGHVGHPRRRAVKVRNPRSNDRSGRLSSTAARRRSRRGGGGLISSPRRCRYTRSEPRRSFAARSN
jgi:hypothetical protein